MSYEANWLNDNSLLFFYNPFSKKRGRGGRRTEQDEGSGTIETRNFSPVESFQGRERRVTRERHGNESHYAQGVARNVREFRDSIACAARGSFKPTLGIGLEPSLDCRVSRKKEKKKRRGKEKKKGKNNRRLEAFVARSFSS